MMEKQRIGILHPGEMGVSIAAAAKNSGHRVCWVSDGRSAQTRARAAANGLEDRRALVELCADADVLISVCPPAAAEEVAAAAVQAGFAGLYLDANAIAPGRAARIGERVAQHGGVFVDGGIIGGPAWEPGRTWLYLSGEQAGRAAELFAAGPLETKVIGPEIGKASALKMCFSAYTKGTTALICGILGAAENLGVREALLHPWSRGESDFAAEAEQRARRVTRKAWRFTGEMDEIAATFEEAGMPAGFHTAAAAIFERIGGFKDAEELPPFPEVLAALSAQ
jgi:3-hydroxyisobutyrate dehydrogenase-like beta-hydroxyacid dehydrogenase